MYTGSVSMAASWAAASAAGVLLCLPQFLHGEQFCRGEDVRGGVFQVGAGDHDLCLEDGLDLLQAALGQFGVQEGVKTAGVEGAEENGQGVHALLHINHHRGAALHLRCQGAGNAPAGGAQFLISTLLMFIDDRRLLRVGCCALFQVAQNGCCHGKAPFCCALRSCFASLIGIVHYREKFLRSCQQTV